MNNETKPEAIGIFTAIGIVLNQLVNTTVKSIKALESGVDSVDNLATAAKYHTETIALDAELEAAPKRGELQAALKKLKENQ